MARKEERPCCGALPVIHAGGASPREVWFYFSCGKCGRTSKRKGTRRQAVQAWNRELKNGGR